LETNASRIAKNKIAVDGVGWAPRKDVIAAVAHRQKSSILWNGHLEGLLQKKSCRNCFNPWLRLLKFEQERRRSNNRSRVHIWNRRVVLRGPVFSSWKGCIRPRVMKRDLSHSEIATLSWSCVCRDIL
jgi:hypothetical protein